MAKRTKRAKKATGGDGLPEKAVKKILREFGLPAATIKALPEPVAQAIAGALETKRQLDAETSIILGELTRLGQVVKRRQESEAETKAAHSEAKRDLDKALEQEHEAVLRLSGVQQGRLPMPAEPKPEGEDTVPGPQVAKIRSALSQAREGMTVLAAADLLFGQATEGCQAEARAALESLVSEGAAERIGGKDGTPVYRARQSAQDGPGAPKSAKAPKGKRGASKRAAAEAEATTPPEELVEHAAELLAGLRRHKDGKKTIPTKGIGPTGLARKLFGQASAELKARARTILDALEERGVVARVEGANKEPSYFPLDPAEAAAPADAF